MSRSNQDPFIYGYTDQLSIPQGAEIGFCVSTNLSSYSVEVSRMGKRRQIMWSNQHIVGFEHPVPDDASENGCSWPVSFFVDVGPDWPSGYYHAHLQGQNDSGMVASGDVSFVVRSAHPGRDASILLQRPTNTEAAYNSWGGSTFYNGPHGPARRLSFDRPFAGFPGTERLLFSIADVYSAQLDHGIVSEDMAAAFAANGIPMTTYLGVDIECPGKRWHTLDVGHLCTIEKDGNRLSVYNGFSTWLSCWYHWERHFVAWAEAAGYAIDYAVNGDLEFQPDVLGDYRLILSVGHDEYWSAPMRDHLETFITNGGNVAFFSGNVCWWQVRSEESGRALVCWKDQFETADPHFTSNDHDTLSTLWCNRLIGRPENRMTGVSFAFGGYHGFFGGTPQTGAYTVHRPEHWMFADTGLKRGDLLGEKDQIVSYECDGCEFEIINGLPSPTFRDGTPESFEIMATAPARLSDADNSIVMASEAIYGPKAGRVLTSGAAVLGSYVRGGTVVTTGCTDWCMGLAGNDPTVCQITANILDRLS